MRVVRPLAEVAFIEGEPRLVDFAATDDHASEPIVAAVVRAVHALDVEAARTPLEDRRKEGPRLAELAQLAESSI